MLDKFISYIQINNEFRFHKKDMRDECKKYNTFTIQVFLHSFSRQKSEQKTEERKIGLWRN